MLAPRDPLVPLAWELLPTEHLVAVAAAPEHPSPMQRWPRRVELDRERDERIPEKMPVAEQKVSVSELTPRRAIVEMEVVPEQGQIGAQLMRRESGAQGVQVPRVVIVRKTVNT